MKDYAQYMSRIPSPGKRPQNQNLQHLGPPVTSMSTPTSSSIGNNSTPSRNYHYVSSSTTRNVKQHPLTASNTNTNTNANTNTTSTTNTNTTNISSSSTSSKSITPSTSPDRREQQSTATTATASTVATSTITSSTPTRQQSPPSNNNSNQNPSSVTPATPPPTSTKITTTNSNNHHNSHSNADTLDPVDALSVRHYGSEATIVKLRQSLEEAHAKDISAKAALAKSDAIILELRSSIRQLKRQVEILQHEKLAAASSPVTQESSSKMQQLQQQIEDLQQQLQSTRQNTAANIAMSSRRTSALHQQGNETIGELQVQLDRAHAQILTADMVRKELEDTLEAEQYTWELRVQDQERTISQLQRECDTLAADLEACRSQWKEAEHGWNAQVEDLQQQLREARTRIAATQALNTTNEASAQEKADLMSRIQQLEKERAELQNCLDEALQELEAVDAELQAGNKESTANNNENNNHNISVQFLESLQHLLRWILQEGPVPLPARTASTLHNLPNDPTELLEQIQQALEKWIDHVNSISNNNNNENNSQSSNSRAAAGSGSVNGKTSIQQQHQQQLVIDELQDQIHVYQEELKSREESSAELRESLKEAVALLKPLQDAVAKAEEEKDDLQRQLDTAIVQYSKSSQQQQRELESKTKEVKALQEQIEFLQQQVEEHKHLATARQSLLTPATPSPAKNKLNNSIQSTSPDSEDSLTKIQRARDELRRKRETEGNLQQLLKEAQTRFHSLHEQNENVAAKNRELQGQLKNAQEQITMSTSPVPGSPPNDNSNGNNSNLQEQLQKLQKELEQKQAQVDSLQKALKEQGQERVKALDQELAKTKVDLAHKEHAEKVLNKSLKDALSLLKPLQMHLEEAEKEKMEISKELRNLRKRFRQLQMGELSADDLSKNTLQGEVSYELIKIKEELEETVRQLELENSQLHDALEDLSEMAEQNNFSHRSPPPGNGSSGSNSTEARLRQQLVEVHSRYEVTQNKLEDAHVENHALVRALKQKEAEEKLHQAELKKLRDELAKKELELHNAKTIAKTALVKVEELTMSNIEQMSLSRDGSVDLNFSSHTNPALNSSF